MFKKIIFLVSCLMLFFSCSEKQAPCDEHSYAYWTTTMTHKPHNTKIPGEKVTIRKAYSEVIKTESNIQPNKGFLTLKIHIDKYGNFCSVENYQIDQDYQNILFNNGELSKKLEQIASELTGWTNDTETKTYYLIKFKIEDGKIKEVF